MSRLQLRVTLGGRHIDVPSNRSAQGLARAVRLACADLGAPGMGEAASRAALTLRAGFSAHSEAGPPGFRVETLD